MEKQFGITKEKAIDLSVNAVKLAKTYTDDIEYSAMDATRTDIDFLYKILEKTIDAGATTINIPDTVGYTLPEEFGKLKKLEYLNLNRNRNNNNHCTIFPKKVRSLFKVIAKDCVYSRITSLEEKSRQASGPSDEKDLTT